MGQEFDILWTALFSAIAIGSIVMGIRWRDPPKRIRERSSFIAFLALLGVRGLLPNSWRGSAIEILAAAILVGIALWKCPSARAHPDRRHTALAAGRDSRACAQGHRWMLT